MSSSRTPKTVTPVPAAAYPTDRKLKAIENKLKTVTEDMIKIGNELKRAEMREREHHEVCNIILRNQARIETKIDILFGKEIPKPSDSPVDFVMSSLVPSDENNGHTFPQERVPTKAYLEEQAKQKTDSNQRVDLKILTTFGLYNALKDISPFVQVPDFITEEYKGELLILIKQPETTIPASVAVEKIQQFMTGQQENGFSSRYRILPSDAKIIVSYEGKRIRLNRLGDYLKYKEKFVSIVESESENTQNTVSSLLEKYKDINQHLDTPISTVFGFLAILNLINPDTLVPDFICEEDTGKLVILINHPEKMISASNAVEKIRQFTKYEKENCFSRRYKILPTEAKIIVSYKGNRIKFECFGDYVNYKDKFTSNAQSENKEQRSFADLFIFDFNSRDSMPLMREQKEKVEEKPGEITVNKLIDLLQSENPHKRMFNLRPILTTDSRVFLVPDFMNLDKSITRLEFSARLLDLIGILKTTKGDFAAKEYLFRPVFVHNTTDTTGTVFVPLTSTESLFFKS